MYQTEIINTDGRTAMDSRGSTLFIAGNAPVVPGKMVWTDGKIIYGSIPTGGEAYIPVSD